MNPQFGTNANAVRKKRVYYTETSTIYEGMPVCYEYDATANVLGYDKAAGGDAACQSSPSTTAEGYQNEGKFLRVENPNLVLTIVGTIVGTYIVGETVTQTSTTATGIVDVANTDATEVYIRTLTGTFAVATDTITGGTSGATMATATAISVTTDNLAWFAGVVAGTSEAGKTGPRWLDIYLPNGAIVPVKTVLAATTAGQTILAINTSTQTFGNPTSSLPNYANTAGNTDARSVALAEETITSAGLVLAKLDPTMFMYQGGQVGREMLAGYVGTVNTAVNRMNISFAQTSGNCQALHYRALLTGAGGGAARGIFRFDGHLTSSVAHPTYVMDVMLDITGALGDVWVAPLHLTVRSRNANPVLTTTAVYAIKIDWNLTKAGTVDLDYPPGISALFYVGSDYTQPLYFLYTNDMASIAGSTASGTAAFGATDIKIPLKISGQDYYLMAVVDGG